MTRPDVTPQRPELRTTDVVVRREIDLPPGIVWSALLEPELLAGWLATATIDDDLGFVLRLPVGAQISGRVTELVEAELLTLATDRGHVMLRLEEHGGGLRGSWTVLTVGGSTSVASSEAWDRALDRLEELLHGHPTDWSASPGSAAVTARDRKAQN